QDGLVHISALADRYVKDPREVVRVGQTVQVKVQEVDPARKRIALTMRLDDEGSKPRRAGGTVPDAARGQKSARSSASSPVQASDKMGAMAAAFAKLRK